MAVKIRLMRIGAKKRPFYRVVAVDEHKKRTGAYIELLGTYNPLTDPKEIILKQDRIDDWVKKGAVLSDGFLRVIGKAPQRPPRKAKKEKKETPVPAQPETSLVESQVENSKEQPTESDNTPAEAESAAEPQAEAETPTEAISGTQTPESEPHSPDSTPEQAKEALTGSEEQSEE